MSTLSMAIGAFIIGAVYLWGCVWFLTHKAMEEESYTDPAAKNEK